MPGLTGTESPLFYNKHFEFQPYGTFNYANPAVATVFGTPPDPMGAMTVAADIRGQPLWGMELGVWSGNAVNSPYELDLSAGAARGLNGTAATDNPFSPAELEALLRPYDSDASTLPARLATLTSPTGLPASSVLSSLPQRTEITTESWDVPCPPSALSINTLLEDVTAGSALAQKLTSMMPTRHVTDYLAALLVKKNNLHGGTMAKADALNFILGSGPIRDPVSGLVGTAPYFPLDLLAGRKMDLNRPFGSGAVSATVPALNQSGTPVTPAVPFDYLNNGTGNPNGYGIATRQAYARQLYLLAMLLIDDNYTFPVNGETPALTPVQQQFLTARRIAQWAINVACFRSNDSIMVPFEFDAKPFTVEYPTKAFSASTLTGATDPWDVDGDLTTDETTAGVSRGVVWGCKRPELLVTETLAFHDRRVADTNIDNNTRKKRTDNDGTGHPFDVNLDQTRIPQGSAFFELYCTRDRSNTSAPTDLYSYDATVPKWYLDLGRPAPQASTDGNVYPVWRMVISGSRVTSPQPAGYYNYVTSRMALQPDSSSLEPEQYHTPSATYMLPSSPGQFSLLVDGSNPNNVAIDRIVWFTTIGPNIGAAGHLDNDRIFYGRTTGVELGGGEYCVVGPRAVTHISALNAAATGGQYGVPSPQQIVLNPTPLPSAGPVNWTGSASNSPIYPVVNSAIKPAWGMVVAANPPSAWGLSPPAAPNGIGISVSEPLPTGGAVLRPTDRNK